MSVDSKMTAIADAIRAHTGGADSLTLDGMAEAIEALETGGGKILGHTFAEGSFTLAEDVSSTYSILSASELFEAVKDDFPNATDLLSEVKPSEGGSTIDLHYFIGVFIWKDNSYSTNVSFSSNELLGLFRQVPQLLSSNSAVAYANSYGSYSARSAISSYANLGHLYNGLTLNFSSSCVGYAGGKYNWIVFVVDHGEVV